MHAGWNALGKGRVPTAAFFLVASLGGLVLLVAVPILYPRVVAGAGRIDIALVCAAGLFEAIYMGSLARGYRAGDLSIVYPLARAVPAITVAFGSVLLGRAEAIPAGCWAGSILIVAGCILLPKTRLGNFRLRDYANKPFLYAMLAAVGTTGYSLVDDTALGRLRFVHADLHPAPVTLVYSFFQVLMTAVWLAVLVFPRREGRRSFRGAIGEWRSALVTGALMTLTYAIVLIALAFAKDVSYVVAFRQASIPIGVLIGVVWFKEAMPLPKLLGTVILLIGLVLVSLS